MKSFIKTVIIALGSAVFSIFIYDVYFSAPLLIEKEQNLSTKILPTNYTYTTGTVAAELTDFTIAAEKTVNAVVHVKNTSSGENNLPSYYRYFYDKEDLPKRIGTGSGVIVSPNGFIITNNHVIENNTEIEITTNENKIYKAQVVGTDPDSDIAVLKINANEKLPYVFFGNSDTTKIGEWVLAVGNPFNLNSTVTAGIISAKSRDLNTQDGKNEWYIQTDAAVNKGNSGGALVNTRGELIGINTAITSISGGFVGYSFAVPSNVVRKIFEDIIEFGNVQRGLLGVMGQVLNSDLATRFDVLETEGFYITNLEEGLGADLAGLKPNDIIKSIDGIAINKFADLSGYLASKRPGEKVNIKYNRAGKETTISVRLEKINRASYFLMELRELTSEQKKHFETDQGLYISNMNNRWLYQKGIDNGFLILEINDQQVNRLEDLKKINIDNLDSILFLNPSGEELKISMHY